MQAAVIEKFGDTPQFEDFPDPKMEKEDRLIHVKAVALENFDKVTAKGTLHQWNRMSVFSILE